MNAGRDEFLERLSAEFPAVVATIDDNRAGLLHCEMAHFRAKTEQAMDAGRFWEAERHFRLVAELLEIAGPELLDALNVSYLYDLALCEWTPQRYQAIQERMPEHLRHLLIEYHEQWK